MNRQTKRRMERRGEPDGEEVPLDALDAAAVPARSREEKPTRARTSPVQFAREVRDELRQVAWPTRAEMINYTTVVFFTLVLMITLIFLLNYIFGKAVIFMFQK